MTDTENSAEEKSPHDSSASELSGLVMRLTGWIGKADLREIERVTKAQYQKHGEDKTIMPTLYKTKGRRKHWPECDWPPVKISITIKAA